MNRNISHTSFAHSPKRKWYNSRCTLSALSKQLAFFLILILLSADILTIVYAADSASPKSESSASSPSKSDNTKKGNNNGMSWRRRNNTSSSKSQPVDSREKPKTSSAKCGADEELDVPPCRGWTWGCDSGRLHGPLNGGIYAASRWDSGSGNIPPNKRRYRLVLSPPECNVNALTYQRVHRCLAHRHILLLGDSVMRYSYINLAHWLETGMWHSPNTKLLNEYVKPWRSLGGFNGMFEGVKKRLNDREICDCSRTRRYGIVENHYYYNPTSNIRLSYAWRTGVTGMRWHDLNWVGERCIEERFRAARHAVIFKGTKRSAIQKAVDEAQNSPPCAQTGCAAGKCTPGPPEINTDDFDGTLRLVQELKPDAVVLNAGLWTRSYETPEVLERLVRLGDTIRAQLPHIVLYWRTTTARASSAPFRPQHKISQRLRQAGWRIIDAGGVTRHLREKSGASKWMSKQMFWDAVHFLPFAYRGLNELLVGDLCAADNNW